MVFLNERNKNYYKFEPPRATSLDLPAALLQDIPECAVRLRSRRTRSSSADPADSNSFLSEIFFDEIRTVEKMIEQSRMFSTEAAFRRFSFEWSLYLMSLNRFYGKQPRDSRLKRHSIDSFWTRTDSCARGRIEGSVLQGSGGSLSAALDGKPSGLNFHRDGSRFWFCICRADRFAAIRLAVLSKVGNRWF